MTNEYIINEYGKRDLSAKYLLTKLEGIYKVIDEFKDKKMYKVGGGRTIAFETALGNLTAIDRDRVITKGDLIMRPHALYLRQSYGFVSISFKMLIEFKSGGNTYFDIDLHIGKYANSNGAYDYSRLESIRSLSELEETLRTYALSNRPTSLEDTLIYSKERLDLLEQVKELEAKMPYYAYSQ